MSDRDRGPLGMTTAAVTGGGAGSDDTGGPVDSFVLFELAGHTFALPVEAIGRVVGANSPSPLPGAPPEVLGVVTVRGAVVAVVDPKVILGLPATPRTRHTRLLTAAVGPSAMAIVVDAVRDVVDVAPGAAAFEPGSAPGVAGTVRMGGDAVVLLDLAAILPSERAS